jgi:hypothetical protein
MKMTRSKMGWLLGVVTAVVFSRVMAEALVVREFVTHLLFGFWDFIIPRVALAEWNSEMFASFLLSLAFALSGLHLFMRRWSGVAGWSLKSSLAAGSLVLLLFVTCLCSIGVVHQIGWLRVMKKTTSFNFSEWEELEYEKESGAIQYVWRLISLWAEDHGGLPPAKLSLLVPEYVPSEKYISLKNIGACYLSPGDPSRTSSDTPILLSKVSRFGNNFRFESRGGESKLLWGDEALAFLATLSLTPEARAEALTLINTAPDY